MSKRLSYEGEHSIASLDNQKNYKSSEINFYVIFKAEPNEGSLVLVTNVDMVSVALAVLNVPQPTVA